MVLSLAALILLSVTFYFIVKVNAIMLSVIRLSVILLNVVS